MSHIAPQEETPVATLAWPTHEQQIRLDAVAVDGRLVAKRLVTTRSGGIAAALAARPVADIPQNVARLFPFCGMAHAAAALAAIETALRIDVSPAQSAFRALILLAEHGAALGWRILMDWPPLIGEAPQLRACADIRRAAAAVSAGAQWARIGGARLRLDRDGLGCAVSELARQLIALFPEAADPALTWSALQAAIQSSVSTPARLIKIARAGATADYGRHDRPPLPAMDAGWFAARLAADTGFSDAPTLDGTPAEVGALAAGRHPLVADAIAAWGPTLATRLLAAALDASVVAGRLCRMVEQLADDDPVDADLTHSGHGAGVVETARGPLAYFVDTADGRVRTLRSVAPTEWNFHADGPFMAALAAAPRVAEPLLAARLLAASFDPCVAFSIDIADDRRPPPNAEAAAHA
jgi:coenzyme F420-reducing hydrogenase alpha subunit